MNRSIRETRGRLGYTQQDVANELGTSTATISNIEHGKNSSYRSKYLNSLHAKQRNELRVLVKLHPSIALESIGELVEGAVAD